MNDQTKIMRQAELLSSSANRVAKASSLGDSEGKVFIEEEIMLVKVFVEQLSALIEVK